MIETILHESPSSSDCEQENSRKPEHAIKDICVRIIDFNSSSVRIINETDRVHQWTNAIGTWNYCAPEIILNETPYDNSISWTIGILASILIDKYPFCDFITKDYEHKLAPQDTWRKLFGNLYMKFPEHPPLLRKEWYGEPWEKLIWNTTHWCQIKRWTLYEIYKYCYCELINVKDRANYDNPFILYGNIPCIQHCICIDKLTHEKREKTIHLMYNLCMRIKQMNIFPTAVTMFDRCQSMIYENDVSTNINRIACACLLISSCIFNASILLSKTKLPLLLRFFAMVHLDDLIQSMYSICQYLQWKIWEKPAHIIIDEYSYNIDFELHYNRIFWQYVKEAFMHQKNSYTQHMVAEYAFEKIKAHHIKHNNTKNNSNNSNN
jgi:hypothetical protein